MTERHARPVVRSAEVVFEVQTDVPRSLFEKRCEMLVIAMSAVVSKPPGPGLTKFASEWFNHGIPSLEVFLWSAANRAAPILLLDYYIYPDKTQVAKIQHRGEPGHFPPGSVGGQAGPLPGPLAPCARRALSLTPSQRSTMFRLRRSRDFWTIGIGQDARLPDGIADSDGLASHFTSETR